MDPFLLFMFHVYLCFAVLSVPCSFVIACWERADLLALLCVAFSCVSVTFPYAVLGQVWYLILSVTSTITCFVARCLINVVYLTACAFIRS